MLIRYATPEDADAFAAVVAQVAEEGWLATEPPVDVDAFAARVRDMLAAGTTFFVLDDGGRIVGTLGLHPTHADGVAALGMSVLAEVRGQGWGRALLQAAIDHARGAQMHKIELEVWPAQHARDRPLRALRLRARGRAPRPLPPARRVAALRAAHGAAADLTRRAQSRSPLRGT